MMDRQSGLSAVFKESQPIRMIDKVPKDDNDRVIYLTFDWGYVFVFILTPLQIDKE